MRKVIALVASLVIALVAFLITALLLTAAQDLIASRGIHVVDQGDEWHPVSMILLLVVPVLCAWWTARAVLRRELPPHAR